MANGYCGKMLHVDLTIAKSKSKKRKMLFTGPILAVGALGTLPSEGGTARIDLFAGKHPGPRNRVMTAPPGCLLRFTAVGKSPVTGTAGESEAAVSSAPN